MESENYHDIDGNPVTLEKLCRTEPGWACSRIRHMRKQLEAQLAPAATAEQCTWKLEDEDLELWDTGCGEAWVFSDGGPQDSGVKYCPACGKPVAITAPQQGGE